MKLMLNWIWRHSSRNFIKTLLSIVIAAALALTLGYLHRTIIRAEDEIQNMFDTTIVQGMVRPPPGVSANMLAPFRYMGNVIGPRIIREISEMDFVENIYLEAGHMWSKIVRSCEEGFFPENWMELAGFSEDSLPIWSRPQEVNRIFAVNDLGRFIQRHSLSYLEAAQDGHTPYRMGAGGVILGDMHIEFGDGYDVSDFTWADGEPIPILLSEYTKQQRGLNFGDIAYIKSANIGTGQSGTSVEWLYPPAKAVVIGVHNNNIISLGAVEATVIPLNALENILEDEIGYITFEFDIRPEMNRELLVLFEQLRDVLRFRRAGSGWAEISVALHDEELRIVVGSMEQNLHFMRLLYPVAVVVSIIIGAGLSLLLILQNAKNAAIMRMLGSTKNRTRAVLWIEQLAVCLIGLIIGLAAVFILDWGALVSVMLAGLYLVGVVIGSVMGSVLVTSKPPLELLQVKA